jgi:flagellar L-ring protein precursor FlgH
MSKIFVQSVLALASLLACTQGIEAQNLYARTRNPTALIKDHRAAAVGDILTVIVAEAHKVKNEDKVNRFTDTDLAARLEAYSLSDDAFDSNNLPRLDIRSERGFTGEGKQEKDSNLTARVAVVVVDVHPNGNLVVAGTRIIQIDDETKTLRISGLVRPLDVTAANTVTSSQVADARVSLTGEGANTRSTTRGPIAVLADTLIWAAWPF